MKNMFGFKALNGRLNKDFQIIEKKVINQVKLKKSFKYNLFVFFLIIFFFICKTTSYPIT